MIQVQTVQPIDSPAYDLGLTEEEVRDRVERHFQSRRAARTNVTDSRVTRRAASHDYATQQPLAADGARQRRAAK